MSKLSKHVGTELNGWSIKSLDTVGKSRMFECQCLECGSVSKKDASKFALGKRAGCANCRKLLAGNESTEAPVSPILELDTTKYTKKLASGGKKIRRYIVTSAQSDTPVHKGFMSSLHQWKDDVGGKLIIIPFRYKNPTSLYTKVDSDNEWWVPEVTPYLMNDRLDLSDSFVIMGDLKSQPTAVRPLSGLKTMSGKKSCIFGHPKIELETVPTPQNELPKIITTSGACTVDNYTDTKSGKKGEFHHSIGAVVVEIRGDKFFMRHIVADDDGSFNDLNKRYTPTGVSSGCYAEALVLGDIHVAQVDPEVVKATFTKKTSIVNTLKPKNLIWHDVLDFKSRNHHDRKNFFENYRKHATDTDDVQKEVFECIKFIDDNTNEGTKSFIIKSNHDEALDRWLNDTDPKYDPKNAYFYYQTMANILPEPSKIEDGVRDPLEFWASVRSEKYANGNVKFLKRDEHLNINGVEMSYHGDRGANGGRGSANNFAQIGVKTFIGHSHSPKIVEGCFQVGLSAKYYMGYNVGASSWLHCHGLQYTNGKRTLLFIVGEEWNF